MLGLLNRSVLQVPVVLLERAAVGDGGPAACEDGAVACAIAALADTAALLNTAVLRQW